GPELVSAVRYLNRLAESGEASTSLDSMSVPTAALVEAPGTILTQLGLPAVAPLSLKLVLHDRVEAPDGEIRLSWSDSNYRTLTSVRQGLIVSWFGRSGRLTAPVYELVKAVEHYNGTKGQASEARIAAWAPVQQRLEPLAGKT